MNIDNFRQLAREIYPPSLELSQENEDLNQANVLDMNVTIQEGFFRTKVYNKTDSFPFEVISMPFKDSNINDGICYKVFYGQILRYQRLCSAQDDFKTRVRHLGISLLNRGYRLGRLEKEFRQVVEKYRFEFERWDIPSNSQIWFHNIFSNSQNNNLTVRPPLAIRITSFSQPLIDGVERRPNFLSQH